MHDASPRVRIRAINALMVLLVTSEFERASEFQTPMEIVKSWGRGRVIRLIRELVDEQWITLNDIDPPPDFYYEPAEPL